MKGGKRGGTEDNMKAWLEVTKQCTCTLILNLSKINLIRGGLNSLIALLIIGMLFTSVSLATLVFHSLLVHWIHFVCHPSIA